MSKPSPQPERAPLEVVLCRGSVHNISQVKRGASNNTLDLLLVAQRERLDELERDIDELRNANAELRASLYRNSFRAV